MYLNERIYETIRQSDGRYSIRRLSNGAIMKKNLSAADAAMWISQAELESRVWYKNDCRRRGLVPTPAPITISIRS